MTISELFPYQATAIKNISATVTAIRESDIKTLVTCRNETAKEAVKGAVKLGVYLAGGEVIDTLAAGTPAEGLTSWSVSTVFKVVDALAVAGNAVSCAAATVITISDTLASYGDMYRMAQEKD